MSERERFSRMLRDAYAKGDVCLHHSIAGWTACDCKKEASGMKPSTESAIEHIEEIRKRNNKCWMDLVRLAVEYAPPTKVYGVLHDIEINDCRVNEWLTQLRETLDD